MPVRFSALMYRAAPKYRQERSPKECLPSLAMGRALPASAPRGLLPPAPYASAHGAGRYNTKKAAPERCPARKPGGKARKSREQREPTTRARMSWEKFRKTEKCCEASIQGQLCAVQMRMARRRKRRRAVQGTRKGSMNASVKMYENMIKYVT